MTELRRRLLAELLGSALLAAIVVGSGIAAARLSPDDTGLQLLENAAATAAGLFAIILMFGPISGAHFNPVVSLVDAAFGGISRRDALAYIPAQVTGCVAGAVLANAMFAEAAVSIATTHRATGAHLLAEVVATVGLLLVIFSLARTGRGATAPAAVGAYIGAAYWFTSSHQLRQPRDHGRPDVLRQLRRDRPGVRAGLRRRAARRRRARARADPRAVSRRHAAGCRGGRRPAPRAREGHRLMSTVLFVCLHNAGRSQMSRALFDQAAAGDTTR